MVRVTPLDPDVPLGRVVRNGSGGYRASGAGTTPAGERDDGDGRAVAVVCGSVSVV